MDRLARVVSRRHLHDRSGDTAYWRAQPPAERVAAVEELRQRQHGWTDATRPRLQRVHRIVATTPREVPGRRGIRGRGARSPEVHGDLDVWVLADARNAQLVIRALDDFGFGSVGLTSADFQEPGQVVQLGYPPLRIDLLTSIDGVEFDGCHTRRMDLQLDDLVVPFIGLADLLRNKAASGRSQDVADIEALDS